MGNGIAILKTLAFWTLLSLGILLTLVECFSTSWTHGPRSEKKIALTLDDGPNPPYTEKFLELLRQHQIRATFFFIGRNIEMHRETALKVYEAGHEIGNHSYSHESLTFRSSQKIIEEIRKTDQLIRSLGYRGPIPFRAPFGNRWGMLIPVLFYLQRANTLYDVAPDPPDYFRSHPIHLAHSSVKRTRPGSVLLFHDGEGIRAEALEAMALALRKLKESGYQFVPVSELYPAGKKPEL